MGPTALSLVMLGLAGTTVASTATAANNGQNPSAASAGARGMRVGLTLVPAPLGALDGDIAASDTSAGSVFAFGVMTTIDFTLRPNVFIGFAPSYTFHIKPWGADGDPTREFDLLLRLGYIVPVCDRVHAYGYVAPGYSFITDFPGGGGAQGLVIGVHGGGQLDLTPRMFLDAELGYQAGFQRDMSSLTASDERTSFVQLGVGVGVRI